MAAVAAGYGKGLVSSGWPALLPSCTNGRRKRCFHLVGFPFLAFQVAFNIKKHSVVGGPPTIECLLMSGCGQGYEPAKDI